MLKNVLEYFIKHKIVSYWIVLVIVAGGVIALFSLNKRLDPKFEVEEISIEVPYPGASAVEVEEGIIIKIEENLRGLEGIEKIVSNSQDGYGWLNVEITQGYDMNKALQNIKNSVNSINSYPVGAEKPVVYQDTQWTRAIMFSIYGPEDMLVLKKIVEEFRDDLLRTGKISEVRMWGIPTREIAVMVSPEDLIRYKLTVGDIAAAIRNSNLNISSGSVLTDQEEILIRSYNKKYEAEQLEGIEVVSSIDGRKVELADICTVKEQWPENRFYSEYNGRKSVGFNVMYNNNEDVVEVDEIATDLAKKYEEKYAGLVKFNTLIKETDELQERITLLSKNGILGFFLVILILSLFLNLRLSFWVALGIPVSFMGMFAYMYITGISINQFSLFGMIMVIGILVDDGIIVGESIYSQYEKYGKKPLQAAIDGTLDVIKPVTISILTTIVAFIPYFYFYGYLGKYVWQIAAIVIVTLLFSLIEAGIILPVHLAHSKALQKKRADSRPGMFARMRMKFDAFMKHVTENIYGPVLKFSIKNRWTVASGVVAALLITTGLLAGSHVKSQFFPEIVPPYARIQVEVPAGMSAEVADGIRKGVIDKALAFSDTWEKAANDEKRPIQNYTSWMNGGTINIFFVLPSQAERSYTFTEFSNDMSAYIGTVPEAENIIVGGWSFGGTPISVRFQSHDYKELMKAKELLKEKLKNIDGVKDIRDDTPYGNNEFVVNLKPKGKALGFTLNDLTSQLRQGFYGQEVMRLQKGRDEVKIWVRFNKEDRVAISQIENLKVRTPAGAYVPFKEVASYDIQRSIRRIRHENGERSVTVYADMDYSKNDLGVVNKELDASLVPSVLSQVSGVTRSYGGQSEEVDKMLGSIVTSMGTAVLIMMTILMFLFKSAWQTVTVMFLIVIGIIGAVIGHLIMGIPVSILSLLGLVALAGIIVNDSVVLVDKYNNLVAQGWSVKVALYEAGVARFRPIILTTFTTAAGLAPIIFLTSEQGQFLVPMAVSVAFGLLFGTVITLLMLPSALYSISDMRRFFRRHKDRRELEPAYQQQNSEL